MSCDRAAMRAAFDAAEKQFGTVTILVNNAGVAHAGRAVDLPKKNGGACCRPISTRCSIARRKRRAACSRPASGGAIVNIASVLGFGVDKGVVAYATAKAGVIQ